MSATKQNSIPINLNQLSSEMKTELTSILEFWSTNARDDKNGGFIGQIDHFGKKDWKAEKGCVLNARILWTFSAAYRQTGISKYKEIADEVYVYLINQFWDKTDGGFIWSVDYKGKPLNTLKKTYAQGFGTYALSEYNRATGHGESLEYARQLYYIIESKLWDHEYGGYIEALSNNWNILEDMRLSEKDENVPKSMNTHLHILEPYTNLYLIWPDKQLRKRIEVLIELFQQRIIESKSNHFTLFFDLDWTPRSKVISFGHDIEGAWLLHEAALVLNDKTLIKNTRETALKLVDVTLKEGLDTDGSVFNERNENWLDTDKHWWMQAEAMVGMLDAYQIKPKAEYLKHMEAVWYFIKEHIIDKENGGWYWKVNSSAKPYEGEDKVGFWKCPYHNTRALMEVIRRIEEISKPELTSNN